VQRSLSMLVHGYSKSGKSVLAVSGRGPRLLLDVESAARFLPIRAVEWDPRDPPPDLREAENGDGPDTAVVTVKAWQDAVRAFGWLHAGKHTFRSVGVDSISELQQRYIESVAGRATVKIDQWGSVLREVGGFVRDLRDLTTHPRTPIETLIITAMTREVDGTWRPSMQGQLQASLPYLLDVVGWLYVDNDDGQEVRRLLTRRRPKYEAGERVGGRIPPVVTLPMVTGNTLDEVRRANTTMRALLGMVFDPRFADVGAVVGSEIPVDAGNMVVPVVPGAVAEGGDSNG
jgi:hypothetical protein